MFPAELTLLRIDLLYAVAFKTPTLYSARKTHLEDEASWERLARPDAPSSMELEHDDWLQLLLDGRNSVAPEPHEEVLIQTLTLAADLHMMGSSEVQAPASVVELRCNELHNMLSSTSEDAWAENETQYLLV